jgi:PhzF family phenazine biosynthesis protein
MRQWLVDAFAPAPFLGNPAAVLEPLEAWPSDTWMQKLAAENNLSETAFLRRTTDPARFDLRWFTPGTEVPLCGHATLGAAHTLFSELAATPEALTFDTLSGPLVVSRSGELYEMDFPSQPPTRVEAPAGLAEALGAEPAEVWAGPYLVALMTDEASVRGLTPDLAALEKVASDALGGRGNTGVAAEAEPGRPYDVVSRFFAPGSGVPEDPATGSLHCILTPLFADKLGRERVRFFQAYPGRGGELDCERRGARVILRGRGVTIAESRLRVSPS